MIKIFILNTTGFAIDFYLLLYYYYKANSPLLCINVKIYTNNLLDKLLKLVKCSGSLQ